MTTTPRSDRPQDPARHHRPAALRHARLQRRHAVPHPGRRPPRRRGRALRAGRAAVGRVHAVALDGAHRPAPQHPRRVDERRRPARRRAVGGRRAAPGRATAPRWWASPTSSRSSTRSAASPRTAWPAPACPPSTRRGPTAPSGRTEASTTSSWPPTGRWARCTTPAGWPPRTPRRSATTTPCSTASSRSTPTGGGATGAPQVKDNPIPRDWYHTDWVADRTIAWLDGLDDGDDWFCWMSFPDPHHPWDPPASELGRVDWRDVPLPAGYVEDRRRARAHPRRQAPALAALVRRRARVELRGAHPLGAGHAHRRPGARGQRPQRGRGRADRRGARPGARRHRRPGLGRRPRRGVHHRPRRAAGRLRAAVQGPVPRRRADAAAAGVAAGAVGRRRARRW